MPSTVIGSFSAAMLLTPAWTGKVIVAAEESPFFTLKTELVHPCDYEKELARKAEPYSSLCRLFRRNSLKV